VKAKAQIFLSYDREDEEEVEKLYQKLSDAGFKPWMDKKDLLPGERWKSCIQKAIRRSDFFLACLSVHSVSKRGYLQKEIKDALNIWQEKLEDDIYLIPARLKDCEVPERLCDFQWVDLFEEDGWTRLVKAIQEGMKRRAPVAKPIVQKSTPPSEFEAQEDQEFTAKAQRRSLAIRDEPVTSIAEDNFTYQKLWQVQTSFKPAHLTAGSDYFCLVTSKALLFYHANDGTPLLPPQTIFGDFSLAEYTVIGGAATPPGDLLLTLLPSHLSGRAYLLALRLTRQSMTQSNKILCQQIYEAPSTQLSAPIIDYETICLIQQGPALVMLDLEHGQVQRTVPLPKSYNLPRNCASFVIAANRLCLALCDGTILTLDPQTGQALTTLYESRDGRQLSSLTTDGIHLFFGTSVSRKSPLPSHVYAMDVASGQETWDFEMAPDPLGQHRSIEGRPLVINGTVYVTGHNCFIHALDIDTGQELWRYKMPNRIKLGPVWTREAIIVADRLGNIHALQVDENQSSLSPVTMTGGLHLL
jgi:hypothetical protein